jgi:hypothetical protein
MKKQPAKLSVPPPIDRTAWRAMTMGELIQNRKFIRFVVRCAEEAVSSGRIEHYSKMFQMITHIGRLPEFDTANLGKFLDEAGQQVVSVRTLENALETVLVTAGPGGAMPTPIESFEFITTAADMAEFALEQTALGASERFSTLIGHCRTSAIMSLVFAVNIHFGTAQLEEWTHPPDDRDGPEPAGEKGEGD